jgi:hypothetical protein
MRPVLYLVLALIWLFTSCIWFRMAFAFGLKSDAIPAAVSLAISAGCLYLSYSLV